MNKDLSTRQFRRKYKYNRKKILTCSRTTLNCLPVSHVPCFRFPVSIANLPREYKIAGLILTEADDFERGVGVGGKSKVTPRTGKVNGVERFQEWKLCYGAP